MPTDREIQALVRRAQSAAPRCDEAFEQLFGIFFPPIVAFFSNRGFSRPTAEELAQDVFLRVYKNINEFRHQAKFKTWLFTIASSIWKNALRDSQAKKRQGEEISVHSAMSPDQSNPTHRHPPALEDPGSGPLDKVLTAENTRVLSVALYELPTRMRACVELRFQGYKYREIGELLRIEVTTVKTQLKTAHKKLRPKLTRHFGNRLGLNNEDA